MKYIIILLITSILLSSCATIINGRRERVFIYCNQPNTEIFIDGEKFDKIPPEALLVRKRDHVISFKNDKFYEGGDTIHSVHVNKNLLNLIFPATAIGSFAHSAIITPYDPYGAIGEVFTAYFFALVVTPVSFLIDGLSGANYKLDKTIIQAKMVKDTTKVFIYPNQKK